MYLGREYVCCHPIYSGRQITPFGIICRRTSRGRTGGRPQWRFLPPTSCGACLNFLSYLKRFIVSCAHEIHVRTETTKDVQTLLTLTYQMSYNDGPGQALQCSMLLMIPPATLLGSQLTLTQTKRTRTNGVSARGSAQTLGRERQQQNRQIISNDRTYEFCRVFIGESKRKNQQRRWRGNRHSG